ncbi:glycosyltransferase family 39 protein [Phreatobacter stygius]|uniref:Glycosyltransferase family 39 protein n=1 Tax=Phreatobacter stygius TaxID=1940610 RepID=A0A4D7AXM8_9HYPH|nr:glycosyltransferase family 39 protein [Phreatobacter stygius]QCI63548.1 glycosyltransferase family 39 protein [Phreatobacter stygius]
MSLNDSYAVPLDGHAATAVASGATFTALPTGSRTIGQLLIERGTMLFWSLVGLHAAIAVAAPAFGFITLPRDTLEGFIWGRTFQWGFSKHPPLQAWILGLTEWLAPSAIWLAYLYAQICVVITLWAVWRLGRSILGERQGLIAALLTLFGVHYYGPSMATFTPDTLSAPLWALTGLFWWRAVVEERPRAWYGFALAVAFSIYAKYVVLLLVGVLGIFTLATPRGRAALRRRDPWLAALICLVLAAPHLNWVVDTSFSTFGYAFSHGEKATSIVIRLYFCLAFLAAQISQHGMLIVLLLVAVGFGRLRPRAELVVDGRRVPAFEQAALLTMAFAPIAVALVVNFAVGGEFRQGRGTALFAFSGIAALMLIGPRLELGRLRLAAVLALLVIVVLPVGNAFHHHARLAMGAGVVPTLYPAESLADQLTSRWRDDTDQPLRIVIGDRWHAGNVAFYSLDRPLILLDGDTRQAPWVTEEMLARYGGIIVWQPEDHEAFARLRLRFPALRAQGTVSAPSPLSYGPVTTLAYAIVPAELR